MPAFLLAIPADVIYLVLLVQQDAALDSSHKNRLAA
jgi:hypothetical protein